MNDRALSATVAVSVPSLQMNEQELMSVLQNSLYPGAKVESIKLVLGYCKASGLDPMQKPCHIVPISVKQGDSYVMRDVVMPGIGLYRTQASRTGEYAGVTEPEFGPTKTIPIKRKQWNNAHQGDRTFTMVDDGAMEFPEWCRVTVKRVMDGGRIAEFTAKELWLENYATAGNDTTMPNAMWKKRPYAQLAKCTEAQALRKAFPELGAAPTADEMEGKQLGDADSVIIDGATGQPDRPLIDQPRARSAPKDPPQAATESSAAQGPGTAKPAADGSPPPASHPAAAAGPGTPLKESQLRILRAQLKNKAKTDVDLIAAFGPIEKLVSSKWNDYTAWIAQQSE